MSENYPEIEEGLVNINEQWRKAVDLGDWESALSIVNHALHISTTDVKDSQTQRLQGYLCCLNGSAYQGLGQLRLATEWYVKALRLFPDNPAIWVALGSCLMQQNKNKWATACFSKAQEADPAITPMVQIFSPPLMHKTCELRHFAQTATLKGFSRTFDTAGEFTSSHSGQKMDKGRLPRCGQRLSRQPVIEPGQINGGRRSDVL